MRILKRVFVSILSMVMIISSNSTVFAMASDDNGKNINAIPNYDQYLIDSGYPMTFIEDIDDNLKKQLYDGHYTYESSNEIFGIFTEDYNIEYRLSSDGNVIIDPENMKKFDSLIEKNKIVEKIVADKNKEKNGINLLSGGMTAGSISFLQECPTEVAIQALSNWSATITCSQKSYSNGVSTKKLTYSWKWSYEPVWTLTDKVAVAWSGDFTAEPNSIYWTYTKNVGFTGSKVYKDYINKSGYGYDDYECNAGCAKGIDIKGTVSGTYNRYHKGTLSVTLTKRTSKNSRESAIGRYYHKQITPGLSLAFSKAGPSISVSAGSNYDQSSDSATAFWTTK